VSDDWCARARVVNCRLRARLRAHATPRRVCVVQNEAPGDHDVVYAYSWGVFSQHCREARTRARERKSDGARRHSVVDEKDSARPVGEYDDDGDDGDESTECGR